MTSLYVDRRDVHLRHDAGAIVFYENGQRSATVPLAPLTRLILRGKVTLEAALLGHLGRRGVGVLFLSGRHGDPHLLLGPGPLPAGVVLGDVPPQWQAVWLQAGMAGANEDVDVDADDGARR